MFVGTENGHGHGHGHGHGASFSIVFSQLTRRDRYSRVHPSREITFTVNANLFNACRFRLCF